MVYSVGALSGYSGSNKLTIQRISGGQDNGQVVVSAENMQGRDLGFLGQVTGSVSVILGSTDGGLGTEHKVFGSGARIDVNDASQNISFNNSTGMQINLMDNDHEANIQFNNVVGSTLDATGTSRALGLTTNAGSNNNIFNIGWGDAQIVDGGSYNVTSLGSGNAYYASLATSNGAVVFGGAGNAAYNIAGSYGVFQQGSGAATYQINSPTQDETSGYKNAILSDGVSSILDQGRFSLLVSSNSASTVRANGVAAIGILGNPTTLLEKHSEDSYMFAGGRTEINVIEGDSSSGKINLYDQLSRRGWSNVHLNSDHTITDNYYFGGGTSLHGNNITGNFITMYTRLSEILAMGDQGTAAQ